MNQKLTAIIVDDEVTSREILRNYLTTYCPGIDITGEASNIDEAETLIKSKAVQLVFLDIEMPYGNGFDLLERFESINFETVFITAFSDYAIKALNLSAAYYILKPIDIDELILAVNKIIQKSGTDNGFSATEILADNIKAINNREQKIVLPQIDGFEVVKIARIVRAEADNNYTVFHLDNGKKYMISKTLKYYEELLSDFGFLRTHKSHLINLSHVVKYKKGKTGQITMIDKSTVLVSPSAKKDFIRSFAAR